MMPSPTIIRECSACGKHIAEHSIASGNTFGARFWTDGKRVSPMFPDQPWLAKCQHCGALVWVDEQTKVGEIDPFDSGTGGPDRFPDARPASTPTLQDYAGFLGAGVSDKQKERYVRRCAWWVGNDLRRESGQSTPLDAFEAENLRVFVTLLVEGDENDRLMKAEALRELGQFADAGKLLSTRFEGALTQAVSIIRDLNREGISGVTEMRFE